MPFPITTDSAAIKGVIDSSQVFEQLNVTAQNTLQSLSFAPLDTAKVMFIVNGQTVPSIAGSGISVSGQAVTVNSVTLGYNILTTDTVYAIYNK